ncbi:DUF6625 family protein [Emticicia fontis]
MDSRVVILIPYYGKFPWYFPYFLHSCSFNNTIDFLIFSDSLYQSELPENVKIINISFEEMKTLIAEKLKIAISIDFPYKLCDFRPAYGLIFADYIKEHTFWGQGDIDVIYGDLRGFLTDELLSQVDFVSVRHEYTTGCFALYRNNKFINNIFKRSKDYQKVFTTSDHFAFDEFNFLHHHISEEKTVFDIETSIETFTHIIKSAESNNEIKAHFDFILLEGIPGKIKFDSGRVIYKNMYEAALYHLHWLKQIYNPKRNPENIPNQYTISPTRIYHPKKSK